MQMDYNVVRVGTGMQIPAAAASVLNQTHQPPATNTPAPAAAQPTMPPITTQCFMLSNMFDAKTRLVLVFSGCPGNWPLK